MVGLLSISTKKPVNKWLIGFMFLTVGLTVWTAFNDNANKADDLVSNMPIQKYVSNKSISIPGQTSQQALKMSASNPIISWQQLARKQHAAKPYNLFKVHSWVIVPPVVKQKPQPIPPPVAPPAPFTYFGKLEDSPSNMQVFLLANNRLYATKLGEKIDQLWRLDAEDANAIRLTYLPLNLAQVISKSARPAITPAEILPVADNN